MLRTACIDVLLVVLGGCTASPGRTRTGGSAQEEIRAPRLGACRALTPSDVARPSNDTGTVPCSARHTPQTFAIGQFPDAVARQGIRSPALGGYVFRRLGKGNDAYPGDRLSEVRSRDYCSDSVGAWLNYPVDYDYGYTWFHEAEWRAGNRRAICWAKTDQ